MSISRHFTSLKACTDFSFCTQSHVEMVGSSTTHNQVAEIHRQLGGHCLELRAAWPVRLAPELCLNTVR